MTRRALAYFALVFGVGFVLGTVRVLWLAPRVGERWAEIAEAPMMLVAIVLAARFVVRRLPAPGRSSHLASGALALGILVLFELTVVLSLRGIGIGEYLRTRDPVSGSVYAVSLILFALMPWMVASSAGPTAAGSTAMPGSGRRESSPH